MKRGTKTTRNNEGPVIPLRGAGLACRRFSAWLSSAPAIIHEPSPLFLAPLRAAGRRIGPPPSPAPQVRGAVVRESHRLARPRDLGLKSSLAYRAHLRRLRRVLGVRVHLRTPEELAQALHHRRRPTHADRRLPVRHLAARQPVGTRPPTSFLPSRRHAAPSLTLLLLRAAARRRPPPPSPRPASSDSPPRVPSRR